MDGLPPRGTDRISLPARFSQAGDAQNHGYALAFHFVQRHKEDLVIDRAQSALYHFSDGKLQFLAAQSEHPNSIRAQNGKQRFELLARRMLEGPLPKDTVVLSARRELVFVATETIPVEIIDDLQEDVKRRTEGRLSFKASDGSYKFLTRDATFDPTLPPCKSQPRAVFEDITARNADFMVHTELPMDKKPEVEAYGRISVYWRRLRAGDTKEGIDLLAELAAGLMGHRINAKRLLFLLSGMMMNLPAGNEGKTGLLELIQAAFPGAAILMGNAAPFLSSSTWLWRNGGIEPPRKLKHLSDGTFRVAMWDEGRNKPGQKISTYPCDTEFMKGVTSGVYRSEPHSKLPSGLQNALHIIAMNHFPGIDNPRDENIALERILAFVSKVHFVPRGDELLRSKPDGISRCSRGMRTFTETSSRTRPCSTHSRTS